jgi:REP element-mobilizing transposase RayT
MARKLRIKYEGAIYHVTFRGNARQVIFVDDRDRERLTERLGESAEDFGVRVYEYCWMPNHGHLLVETPAANVSAFMASLLTGYTVYYNLRHETSGHVMQGRFGSTVVSGDAYLLRLSRYIHLNPVVTQGCRELPFSERREALRAYEWSSYRKYIGLAPAPPWLIREPLLAMMPGGGKPDARYRRYVEDGLRRPDEAFRLELGKSSLALGPAEFRERMLREHAERGLARREDVSLRHVRVLEDTSFVLQEVCGVLGLRPSDIRVRRREGRDRGIVALALMRRCGLTERAAAEELGLGTGSAVSYLVRQIKARCRVEPDTAELVRRVASAEALR